MTRTHGSKAMWLEALRADGAAFLAAAKETPATATVPSCPGWTMADLVHHLGSVYRWVLSHAPRGTAAKPDRSFPNVAAEPLVEDQLAWWEAQYTSLLATLDGLEPDAPAWNWAPRAKEAIFWHRRMANETAIHRWDAQMAAGQAEPVEVELAIDGVSEVLDTWLPAGRHFHPDRITDCLVALQANDAEHNWHVRLRGEGVALLDTDTIFDDDDLSTRVAAIGTASDLMLALWGRVAWDTLEITGEAALLDALRVG
jgi:uncharacterized protein (TIGR03083 family)